MDKVKVGFKWKSIDGPCKGEWFIVTSVDSKEVKFKKLKNGNDIYAYHRDFFQKYLERVSKHWKEQKIKFKKMKQNLN